MSKFGPKYDSDIPEGHAFQEQRAFHPEGVRLRGAGFRIEGRPRKGEAVWSRRGGRFSHTGALHVAAMEDTA